MGVEFRLLGTLEAEVDGRSMDLGTARQRAVLTVLLLDAGRPVSPGKLVDRVWGDSAPEQARPTVRSYLSRLRSAGLSIERRPDGYVLDADTVDLERFRTLLTKARAQGNASAFAEALGLWRGEPWAGLDSAWLCATRAALEAEHLAARLDHHDVLLRHGEHAALVTDLTVLAGEHPLDERIAWQLVTSLHRGGRQADALRHYESVRRVLADELGTDPSPALQLLHQQLLTGLDVRPRQLPPVTGGFTGRAAQLAVLDEAYARHDDGRPLIVAVHGPGGAGKTTLALQWAHRTHFPDGEVYVDLRGYGPGEPVDPAIALDVVLRAVGTPAARIPHSTEERTALLRSTLAGRRLLLFLDNARDAAQVRPLLPGSGGVVLVTSRSELRGLSVGEGARRLDLGRLTTGEAASLITNAIGADRVAAEPGAVAELVDLCGGLPLALVIAAQQAAACPSTPVAALVDDLRSATQRLDVLSTPDDPALDPRAVFSWSYHALDAGTARAFRYLGLHPAPEFGIEVACVILMSGTAETRKVLDRLVSVHLLESAGRGRYRFHDLLMVYAVEQLVAEDPESDVDAAMRRLLDWYLHTTHRARTAAFIAPIIALPPDPVRPLEFADRAEATAWHAQHRAILLATVAYAAQWGYDRHCWQLATLISRFNEVQRHLNDLLRAAELALHAAQRSGDEAALVCAQHNMGVACRSSGDFTAAVQWHLRALAGAEQLDDPLLISAVLVSIGLCHVHSERSAEARSWLERAVVASERSPHPAALAHAVLCLAAAERTGGDAFAHSEQALTLYRKIGAPYYEAIALWQMAEAAQNPVLALECADEALTLLGAEDRVIMPSALIVKGRSHAALGQHTAARSAWQQALDILDRTADSRAGEVRELLSPVVVGTQE